ncbi:MAG: hypothetical protein JXM71_06885, partial [Spirochaetales bacterium]|nr:hypothetical protein [Spirochaetales bacterium]
ASVASRDVPGLRAGQRYSAFLEINHSFDYNDAWPQSTRKGDPDWSGANGQPSVVYATDFFAGSGSAVRFEPIGQGSVDGSDGVLRPGLDGLTTALSILGAATITSR